MVGDLLLGWLALSVGAGLLVVPLLRAARQDDAAGPPSGSGVVRFPGQRSAGASAGSDGPRALQSRGLAIEDDRAHRGGRGLLGLPRRRSS